MQAQITGIKIGGDPCTSLTLDLQATGTSSAPSFFWNFGDPASGTNDTITVVGGNSIAFPTHTFSSIGVYNVCATFTEPGQSEKTVCRQIFVGLCCTGIINYTDSCVENVISLSLATGATVSSVTWNFGDPSSGSNTANGSSVLHRFSTTGLFTVSASVVADCGSFNVLTNVPIKNCIPPVVCTGNIITADSCLANGTQFTFESASPIIGLNWNFGDPASEAANQVAAIAPKHRFTTTGTFTVSVAVNASCGTFTKTTTIDIIDCNEPPSCNGVTGTIQQSDSCLQNDIVFNLTGQPDFNSVSWNFGDPQSGSENLSSLPLPTHQFSVPGNFTVTATAVYDCGSVSFSKLITVRDCSIPPCVVSVANAFSPNNDGINDLVSPLLNCIAETYDWKIFNRWGQQIFHSRDSFTKWDGKLRSKPLPAGVYYYILRYKLAGQPLQQKSGSITLLR